MTDRKVYELGAFRTLLINGRPAFELSRYMSGDQGYGLTGEQADELAKLIVSLLNDHEIAWHEFAEGKDHG